MIPLANFTLHDQSEHVQDWAGHGFEIDPRPRAPLIDFSDRVWTETRILSEVEQALEQIQAEGFQAVMIGGLSNAMAYAWLVAHDLDLRVVMARTPRERTPDGKFIFRFAGWQELLPPAMVSRRVRDLDALLETTLDFLKKDTGIGQLRQTARKAEQTGPACEYCEERPAFPVRYQGEDHQENRYLCPACDDAEARALEND